MRTHVCALIGLVALSMSFPAFGQRRDGVYTPVAGKTGTSWSLNENHTLLWGGVPYLPIGVRIDGTPEAVQQAKAAGIKDAIVDVPVGGEGWEDTFKALQAAEMRFLVRIDSLAPMARGFVVEPDAYRVAGISQPRTITLDLPGATSAFVVLATDRDGSVTSSARVPVVDGKLTYEAKPAGQLDHVLLIYPETASIEQPDFWDALDAHRDTLLANLKRHAPGPGLRGIVNPLGRTLGLPGRELRFVPTSPYFRMEFRDVIENKYKSLKTAMQLWGLGANDLETFDDLSRLIPLWQGPRGIGMLLDPTTNKTYSCDKKSSTIWTDLAATVNAAGARRFQRIVSAIRSVTDVPVTQEWTGWAAPYEAAEPSVDGVGMRASGTTVSALTESACRATSSVLRCLPHGWLIATDIDLGSAPGTASQIGPVLDDLGSLGARGFFVRTDSPDLVKEIAAESKRRESDPSLATTSIRAIYFPENARNPATAEQLPGGKWWLPTPDDGNRIDLGSLFWAYQMQSRTGTNFVLWTKHAGRYLLRLSNPKKAVFTAVDGHDPEPKITKNGIDVEITQYPLVITGTDEVPIPQVAFVETVIKFDTLMSLANQNLQDITEERIFFRDFATGFDRNPGGNYPQLRTQLRTLGDKLGDVTCLEAERSLDQNFSEAPYLPGCSGNSALLLRTPIPPGPDGYFANFSFQVKSRSDNEVWLAAAIPPERRAEVVVSVNGQPFTITSPPVSLYGDGYGWYKLGVTRLSGNIAKARIQVNGGGNLPIAMDAIILSPRPFTPDGITLPDPIQYPPMNLKGDSIEVQKPSGTKRGRGNGG